MHRYLTPNNILIAAEKWLSELARSEATIAKNNDILMVCIGGSIGKSAVIDSAVSFNQQINCISPVFVDSHSLHLSMQAPHFQKSILRAATGSATPIINRSKWEELLIPLPPLAEQQRIVTKVDELMALCDQLEKQQNNSQTAHQHLVSQLLNALTQAANANDFQHTWQRIASHFDVLFTTEDSINQLKQSILQLAVMGKLVPQNPDDEPASQLLKKIVAEKAQLVKEGKIKAQKPLPPIGDDEKPFELPQEWEWVRLGELELSSEAGWSPQCDPIPRIGDNWGVLKVSAVTWGVFNPEENKALPSN